jgi:cytochrome b
MRSKDHVPADAALGSTAWDLPTRLFHWSIVLLIGLAWWSAEQRLLDWHRRAGYAVLCLLLFRILWGFLGSYTARFASFCQTPARVIQYVRTDMLSRHAPRSSGHNPLGGWSVLAMLAAMLLQTLLGLIAVDVDGLESGPLSYLVSFDTGRLAAKTHHYVFNFLLSLIVLHVAAIAFHYFYKRQNLTKSMITGKIAAHGERPQPLFASAFRAVILFAWSALLVFFVTTIMGR